MLYVCVLYDCSMRHFDSRTQLSQHCRAHNQTWLTIFQIICSSSRNVPRARKELAYLTSYNTPLSKLNCLRRAVRSLMQPVQRANQSGESLTTWFILITNPSMAKCWSRLYLVFSFSY